MEVAVAIAPEQMTGGGLHMSYPRHVREADITVLAENERLRREWDRLWLERQALTREIEKLRQEKSDLQESTLIWVNLYECALERTHLAHALNLPCGQPGSDTQTEA